ncbi:MAG TPA: glycine/sarcosine/betaine reductase component B subunit [Synergistaceae bacterium]|nr:glycine/sarcosine/betaine reductase component B subunit [Synergistaceae bacterium]
MKLELHKVRVSGIRLGNATTLEKGILTVDEKAILGMLQG